MAVALAPAVGSASRWLFLESRRAGLEALVLELEPVDELFDVRVGGDESWVRHGSNRRRIPLSEFLERTTIDEQRYSRWGERVDSLGFYLAEVRPDWIAFHRGGFYDDICGLMYVKPGRPIPVRGEPVGEDQLWHLSHVTGDWYYFETS